MRTAVIAHGNAAPVFDFGEHVFDLVAFFVEFFVITDAAFAVLARWDARGNAFGS